MTKSSVRSKTEVLMLKIKPIILTARTAKNRRRVLDDQKEPSFLQSGSGLTWFLKKRSFSIFLPWFYKVFFPISNLFSTKWTDEVHKMTKIIRTELWLLSFFRKLMKIQNSNSYSPNSLLLWNSERVLYVFAYKDYIINRMKESSDRFRLL